MAYAESGHRAVRGRRAPFAIAVTAAVVLTGCTGSGDPDPATTAGDAATEMGAMHTPAEATEVPTEAETVVPEAEVPVDPAWITDVTMASSLEATGDAVVGYFLSDKTMYMGAWSAMDGTQLWKSEAGLSHTARGVTLLPTVTDDGKVVFLTPEDASGWATMKIVDVASGETEVQSRPVWPGSRPYLCDETPCVAGFARADGKQAVLELDDSREWVPSTSAWIPDNARGLGFSVYGTFDRPGEILGRGKGGASEWERPFEEVFGPGYSSDWGWAWRETDGVLIGWAAQKSEVEGTRDFTKQMVVGLEPESGETKWELPASWLCHDEEDLLVVCTFTAGTMTFGDDGRTYSDDVALSIHGIDPQTGAILWSVPVDGENYGPTYGTPFLSADGTALRYIDGIASEIDLITGQVTAVADTGILACSNDQELMEVTVKGGTEVEEQVVAPVYGACDVNREPSEQFSSAAVRAAGVQAGDVYVVSTESGLQGFRLAGE